jgi:heme/copper-type cytochrome/quinol oxidase subunit 1
MLSRAFNMRQRVVVVIGFGAALYVFGTLLTTRGEIEFGWVAYAPLSNAVNTADFPGGLHSWARLLIWFALIVVWVGTSVVLLRSRPSADSSERAD